MAASLTQDSNSISASIGVFFSVAISRVGGEVVVVGNEKLFFFCHMLSISETLCLEFPMGSENVVWSYKNTSRIDM